MTDSPPDPAVRLAARALAVVLDLEADELRADSPLADLGADATARILWADTVEELAAAEGRAVSVPDDVLRTASTLADLAAPLSAAAGARP